MQITDLKLLIAGCGSIGKRHAQVLWEMGVRNLTACDPFETARESMKAVLPEITVTEDYEEALANGNFDAVFILTPTAMHLDMADKALRAGCHVFLEKPLANTQDGVEELKALAKQVDRKVMVGFCFRYHEVLRKAKQMVDDGLIGRVVNVRALVGEPFYEVMPNYLNMYYAKYSGAFELVHDIDVAIWFAGQDLDEVYSVHGPFSDMGMDSPETVEMLIRFQDRCAANIHLDFFQQPRRRYLEVLGVNGTILVEYTSWDKATITWYNTDTRKWQSQEYATRRNDMFRDEDTEFLKAVVGECEITCTIDEALKSLRAVEAVYRIPAEYLK